MHILNPQSALLSNHELLLHLQSEHADYAGTSPTNGSKTKRPTPPGMTHMLRDALSYLTNPDYTPDPNQPTLTEIHPHRPMTLYKGPHSLFRALAPKYRLNKAEYLQIYNLRPATQVVLDLIVEESSTRFKEEEMADMLEIIHQVFAEEEASIPAGVEEQEMEKIPNKLLGASRRRKKKVVAKKKA